MDEISPQEAKSTIESLAGSTFEAYLHYPFCEQICTFCHFHKQRISETNSHLAKEKEVIDMLIAELKLNHDIMGEPIKARSLQLGGGTPSLMSNGSLHRLLDSCEKHMILMDGAEIKTEIYPKSYNESQLREKLRLLKSFGFTDLVIDLESGNQTSLDAINRRNSSLDDYLRLIDICMSEGFDSFISALMAGLPYETYDSLYNTVNELSKIKELNVINVFPCIMRDTDIITRKLEKNPTGYNDARTRDRMWIMARTMLHERGFVDGPISYLHRPEIRPEQQSDKFECVNLIGIEPSSFGYLNGKNNEWAGQYFNFCNTKDHAQRIKNGYPAIWRLGRYDNTERARRKVIFGLANVKTENLVDISEHYGVDLDKIYGKTFNALLKLGLIEAIPDEKGIRYTQQGLARLEEITYFLYSDFAKNRCDQLPNYSDPHYESLINQHYAVTMTSKDRKLFEDFEEGMDNHFMWRLGI
ncbi:radical SAM protein [Xenorhabdus sp. TH1]|uniref:radical SAM protein n=1 Tax=Xenorhabdus sp. TH1 TaxID=3130166 RepID=UPI0030CAED83